MVLQSKCHAKGYDKLPKLLGAVLLEKPNYSDKNNLTETQRVFMWQNKCFKVTVQFELYFRLKEHISVISCRNLINLYITEKLIKFSKSLFNFYLVISNK